MVKDTVIYSSFIIYLFLTFSNLEKKCFLFLDIKKLKINRITVKINTIILILNPDNNALLKLYPSNVNPRVQPASKVPKLPMPPTGKDSVTIDKAEPIIKKVNDILILKLKNIIYITNMFRSLFKIVRVIIL